jgi:Ca2+-binding RTX toxin-like protein
MNFNRLAIGILGGIVLLAPAFVVLGVASGRSNDHPIANDTCQALLNDPNAVLLTFGNDNYTGTPGNDKIHARGGDDIVRGGGGNDIICGANGTDKLYGDDGNDFLAEGATPLGNKSTIVGGNGDDKLYGMDGIDGLDGGPGHDECHGSMSSPARMDTAVNCEVMTGIP